MSEADILSIAREAIITTLKVGAPIMLIALIVGLLIALFQALTSIQELTLTFVPKILTIFISLIFIFPFMLSTLSTFTEYLFDLMIKFG